jgi:hypothetical protein
MDNNKTLNENQPGDFYEYGDEECPYYPDSEWCTFCDKSSCPYTEADKGE